MSGGELEILGTFVACAIGIPILVVGWMRDPWGRAVERQAAADIEQAAREAAAPHHPHVSTSGRDVADWAARHLTHVDGRPVRLEPCQERVVDVINRGGA